MAGLRVLCIDGGGVRGVVALRILQNLKRRTNKEPHELFDLICGTSTGGILALLLGVLKVPVDHCMVLYETLGKDVFEVGLWQKAKSIASDHAVYCAKTLEGHMKKIIADFADGNAELRLSDVPPPPRVFVVARRGPRAYLFRNYRDTTDAGTAGTHRVCVWQAARATSAAPTYFAPMTVGRHTYLGGGLGHNNPTTMALQEVTRIEGWKDRPITAIVSLGTGVKTYEVIEAVGDKMRRVLLETATNCEQIHYQLDAQRHKLGDYFRFNVSEGVGDFGLGEPRFITAMIEATEAYLSQREISARLSSLASVLTAIPEPNPQATPTTSQSNTVPIPPQEIPRRVGSFHLLRRFGRFIGRDEDLARLHEHLQSDESVAVSQPTAVGGLGGIGKTELVIEYAHRYYHPHRPVFWITADKRAAITSDFLLLARHLGVPTAEKDEDTIQAVKRWLETHNDWLLVFDNAENPVDVDRFIPHDGRGRVVVTTRAQVFGTMRMHPLQVMGADEGLAVLLNSAQCKRDQLTPSELEAAQRIVEELGRLPLALDQAGAYIREIGCPPSRFLELLRESTGDMLARQHTLPRHRDSVAATLASCIDAVRFQSLLAYHLLHLFAFMHPDVIPVHIVEHTVEHSHHQFGLDSFSRLTLDEAIAALRRFSLITRQQPLEQAGAQQTDTVSIHRLVQHYVRDTNPAPCRRQWALTMVEGLCDYLTTQSDPRTELRIHSSQIQVCVAHIDQFDINSHPVQQLLQDVCEQLKYDGSYGVANEYAKTLLRLVAAIIGPTNLQLASAYTLAGEISIHLGDYRDAQAKLELALGIVDGAEHLDPHTTTAALTNLANAYRKRTKYDEAEQLCRRGLAIAEANFGPNHPNVAATLHNLASVYRRQAKYDEAEQLYRRALTIKEASFGSNDPEVAATLHNLAYVYRHQAKYDEAEQLYRRALAIREASLGPNHPSVAATLHSLASVYRRQAKYDEAEQLYRRALAIREASLGPNHPDVAATLHSLGYIYSNQAKYDEAEQLYRRALAIKESSFGPDHPSVVVTRGNLASTLREQAKHGEAESFRRQAPGLRDTDDDPPINRNTLLCCCTTQ